jgi:integrase
MGVIDSMARSALLEIIDDRSANKARSRARLPQVRVHDLRHTYGQRLRDAGVSNEDCAVLMGHAGKTMSEHDATPTIAKLVEMANQVATTRYSTTLLRLANG